MRAKLLIGFLVLAGPLGGFVWWQQGGFGGPVSDEAARRYFDWIVTAAQAKDFQAPLRPKWLCSCVPGRTPGLLP